MNPVTTLEKEKRLEKKSLHITNLPRKGKEGPVLKSSPTSHHHIYVFTYLFVFVFFFVFLQRKVNSTGKCVSIAMQLSTVELACLITSGHMQNEKGLPYLREPVSAISNSLS